MVSMQLTKCCIAKNAVPRMTCYDRFELFLPTNLGCRLAALFFALI